jgi:hypothetical protein
MNIMGLTHQQIVAIVILVLIVAAIIILIAAWQRSRTTRLRKKFGEAEYQRAVTERGGRGKAEALLEERTKRVSSFRLRSLSVDDRARFQNAWANVQAHFVDGPAGAVMEADRLLGDVMVARGYPVSDFDTRAGDVSVDHPRVVQNYRAGHDIAVRQLRGQASTEDLRRAMIHYRALFEDLITEPNATATSVADDYRSRRAS